MGSYPFWWGTWSRRRGAEEDCGSFVAVFQSLFGSSHPENRRSVSVNCFSSNLDLDQVLVLVQILDQVLVLVQILDQVLVLVQILDVHVIYYTAMLNTRF